MACKSCKRKPTNNIKQLSSTNIDDLKTAGEYLSIISQMNDEKWDLVEKVYQDLFGTLKPINRQCKDCLRNVAKAVQYEYNKIK